MKLCPLFAALLAGAGAGCSTTLPTGQANEGVTGVMRPVQLASGQAVHDLPVIYLVLAGYSAEVAAVPGHLDHATGSFYPWDDVLLTKQHLPEWGEPRFVPGIPFVWTGVQIKEAVVPRLAVTVTEVNGVAGVRVGYWDPSARVFLAWVGVGLSEDEWKAYAEANADMQALTRVPRADIEYLSGIAVPRYHAQLAWDIETSGRSEFPPSIQVAPDIEIRAPIELRREPRPEGQNDVR